jgi:4-amino-4-deoxy-L-arabinose transferase-like glycosyltransferase
MQVSGHEPISTRWPLGRPLTSRAADIGCVALLLLLAATIFLLRNSALPMQLWDESRNANSGLEMSQSGNLLVTYFHGAPEHWSTKPPLVIWFIALFLRIGLPPLLAVRLPSILAATGGVLLAFLFCRIWLHDRVAGMFAGLTMLSAPLFVGWHAGRTGDFDTEVALFTLIYTLAFWGYVEAQGRDPSRWLAVAGVAVILSALTKGVGGVLALPGLLLYAIVRGRLVKTLGDWRLWLTLLAIAFIVGGFYGLREHFDPGYLHTVWSNEFTGRYLAVNEQHQGGPFYYVGTLATRFEPGFMLLPLAAVPFFQPDRRRRSVALICLVTSGVLIAVLSSSETKVFWYIVPAVPLLALAAGIGLSDGLIWLRAREGTLPTLLRPRFAYGALAMIFGMALVAVIYYYQVGVERKLANTYMGGRYGPLLEQVRHARLTNRLVILDDGAPKEIVGDKPEFAHYSPEAYFYAGVETSRGMTAQVVVPGTALATGTWVATCDPRSDEWLSHSYRVSVILQPNRWCKLERTLP